MRDRLSKLIQSAVNGCAKYWADLIADKLLAEGAIMPPVVLGSRQKIYIPIGGTTVIYETKVYGIGVDDDADDDDGNFVINPKEYPEDAISINGCIIGKTVFLTREEAEKALAERSENGK